MDRQERVYDALGPAKGLTRWQALQRHPKERGSPAEPREVVAIVIDDERAARLYLLVQSLDRPLGVGRVLNDPQTEHHVELMRPEREPENIGLCDSMAHAYGAAHPVGVDGATDVN